jgi:Mg2+-importing ATPase
MAARHRAEPAPAQVAPDTQTEALTQKHDRYWDRSADDVLQALGSSRDGLDSTEAAARLARVGPNRIGKRRRTSSLRLLLQQFQSPIILILVFASVLSFFLGDAVDGAIILAIILLSGLLGFTRERSANNAVNALLELVRVEAEVRRDGRILSLPLEEVVPGDVALLNAGDLVPGDSVILASNELLVDEAALTGEAYPVEKQLGELDASTPLAQRTNCVFSGTHVVSGSGEAVVVRTGAGTELGRISQGLEQKPPQTGFEQGLNRFGLMLVRATAILLVAIFAVNIALSRPFVDSLLFSLSLAIGITPQLLPAIVSISLSTGARRMAKAKVIVKRLDAIEDFGSMDVLCTDKTGTVTEGAVRLAQATDIEGNESEQVLHAARLNAGLQTGFQNPIDAALLADAGDDSGSARLLAEIPYDFKRKRLSILAADDGRSALITKGAVPNVLAVCDSAETPGGKTVPLDQARDRIDRLVADLSGQGYRVLAVAQRDLGSAGEVGAADEAHMTLVGFLTFLDPPKPGVDQTVRELNELGISLRLITGDSRLAAAHIAQAIGLDAPRVVTGAELDRADDDSLGRLVEDASVFAEVEPQHKERIINALRRAGHVVGFLGDGINDAPALHAANVGISVNTAVDVAKESAAIVMLDRGLDPVVDGVKLGRQTFANTEKYAFTTISANFGNVLSMAVASVVLPFLPLLPRQILLTNFLSDIPSTTIAEDNVDPERAERPQSWDIAFVRDFMIVFGLLSSVFDLITFAVLRLGFDAGATLFHTGWFVESVITELTVLLVLRTQRPFFRSRPGNALLISSIGIAILTLALPYSGRLGHELGFTPLSATLLATMLAITAAYVVTAELVKRVFYRHRTRAGASASIGRPAPQSV